VTEQLISRVNMFFEHYHVSTTLSKKLDASLGYLQLQVGTPQNPFTQDYSRWGKLAPLSWVKMLWKSIHYFNITLHMLFPTIASPQAQPGYYGDYFLTELQFHRDHTDKQMQSISSDTIPLGHNDCGRKMPGAFCHRPRK
jgi:hypothetical protein